MLFRSLSAEDTQDIGVRLGKRLKKDSVVCLFGDLGAGKTTFVKGIAAAVAGSSPEQITSPTFVYLHVYKGDKTVYHFDLYRLRDADEFLSMGFEEFLFNGGVSCIEWSEKIPSLLPAHCVRVHLHHRGGDERHIEITPWDSI